MRKYSTLGNASEMAHFAQLAHSWWDPKGPQRILHKMNVMRMDFIRETLENNIKGTPGYSFKLLPASLHPPRTIAGGMDCLDIGCGGGLLSESLARVSFSKTVLGVDVTPEVINVARNHQKLDPELKKLEYRLQSAESLDPAEKQFDLVTMFEVLEHLDEPSKGLEIAFSLVKPGGWLFLSTINRTFASYLSTIFLGEHVLGIVPVGTHTWSKYINESEISDFINEKHPEWQISSLKGCIYLPTQGWILFDPMSERLHLKALNTLVGQGGGNFIMALHKDS